jgi:glc operon protein GlcG
VAAVIAEAERDGRPMSVVVADDNGDPICCARMDGAPERTLRFAIRKAYTAAVMGRDTVVFKQLLQDQKRALQDYGDPMFTTLQGGVTVMVDGQVVGGFAVGGNSTARDEEIARIGLQALFAE